MDQNIYYSGNDLGAVYEKTHTAFRLWAPTADEVRLKLFQEGDGDCLKETLAMKRDVQGTWFLDVQGDLNHTYYTYELVRGGTAVETQDPYSVATGVNGQRSMVLALGETDPPGFETDRGPFVKHRTDMVITEISVADVTADASANSGFPGKYPGLVEAGTKNAAGKPTGFDYLKELGITHVQIMPAYDFGSVDEACPEKKQYNWGYDPVNYNVPEGSYSTDPFHGEVRVREFKEMVAAFHKAGIGVILDVVYNHTYDLNSCFQKCEPDYYYRKNKDGYSDASACGNEVASEQPMMRKYIVDSVCYWVNEYHVDGFRFDLMGVLDIKTMNELSARLKEIRPDIVLYGEGWTGGDSTIPYYDRALKQNARLLDGIGMFSDDIRDNVRGHVFNLTERGFVNGQKNLENAMRFGVTASVWHPQVDYRQYAYSAGPWAESPENTISYVSCHDNLTLWDKLSVSCPDADREQKLAMNRLAAAIVFTSQGVPFFLIGEEAARSKPVEGKDEVAENSFNLPLYTNAIRYDREEWQEALTDYYTGLIAFRKKHPLLRMAKAKKIQKKLRFVDGLGEQLVAFTLKNKTEQIFTVYNAGKTDAEIPLPDDGEWEIYIDGTRAGIQPLGSVRKTVTAGAVSCMVLVRTAVKS